MDKLEVDSGVYSVLDGESCFPSPQELQFDYKGALEQNLYDDDDASTLTDLVNENPDDWSSDDEEAEETKFRRSSAPEDSDGGGDTRMRRSVSLRSALKSTHSPRRKKMVRFADAMGLDLEHIRHILQPMDDPFPPIPPKNNQLNKSSGSGAAKYIVPCFNLPTAYNSDKTTQTNQVCLESVTVTDFSITGVVKVTNLAFQKQVCVRYSLDRWNSWNEIRASYIPRSGDGFMDKFVFTLFLPHDLPLYSMCELAVRYSVVEKEYWDNNGGKNYIFECCGLRSSQINFNNSFLDHNWVHFM